MINASELGKGKDRESRIVYGQCSELCGGQRQRSRTGYDPCLELWKGRDRESRIVDGQCSELCKGGDRESITVYDQCSEL